METIFELQSFRTRGSVHELVGEAVRGKRRVPFSLPVDGETFKACRRCVSLGDGSRYRLSLRCKWNPFQRRYFSAVSRIEQNRRRLLYFPCTAAYRDALRRLPATAVFTVPPKPKTRVWRRLKAALHISILGFFLAACTISLLYLGGAHRAIAPQSRVVSAAQPPAAPEGGRQLRLAGETDAGSPAGPAVPGHDTGGPTPPPGETGAAAGFETLPFKVGAVVNNLPAGYVALTFDDGPSAHTREIVDILREHQIGATFFFIGVHARQHPEAVRYAHEQQMSVGSHSWSHTDLKRKGPAELRHEITATNDYLTSLTGTPVTLLRPPYGHVSDQLVDIVTGEQMKIVLWNRDPRDWSVNNARDIINYVHNTQASGGIYVLHENERTVQALPEIIRHLKGNNMRFIVLE